MFNQSHIHTKLKQEERAYIESKLQSYPADAIKIVPSGVSGIPVDSILPDNDFEEGIAA